MPHCDDSLKKIGQAIKKYQMENDGDYPATLEKLEDGYGLTSWDFICPAGSDSVGQCSYTYRGCDLFAKLPRKMIVAYDKLALHKGRRNILYADGSVYRPSEKDFQKAIDLDNDYRQQYGLPEKYEI